MKGLQTIKFTHNPTTDMLDDPNITIVNREPLLQERFNDDHIRGIRIMQQEIKKIRDKIDVLKESLENKKTYVEQYREKRAAINTKDDLTALNKRDVANIDCQIKKLQTAIVNIPSEIQLLESQLAEAERKFAAEAREELLEKQKSLATEMQELSEHLVELLAEAVEANKNLRTAYDQYGELRKLTGVDLLGSKIALPSGEMLEYVYGFLKGELENGQHCRTILPAGCPQI